MPTPAGSVRDCPALSADGIHESVPPHEPPTAIWASRGGCDAAAEAAPLRPHLPAAQRDLRFRALWHGSSIGEHRVAFRTDGDRLTVDTHIDIAVKVLFFNVFRLKHDAQEIWRSGRLVSVTSTTNRDGTRLQVSGNAVADGFRSVGENGPFLAAADLLTTDALWDMRIVHEQRLIDVQYGGEARHLRKNNARRIIEAGVLVASSSTACWSSKACRLLDHPDCAQHRLRGSLKPYARASHLLRNRVLPITCRRSSPRT
jgi:hypothetical protein